MTPSQKYLQKLGLNNDEQYMNEQPDQVEAENGRRSFLRKSALGGITLGGALLASPIEDIIAQTTQKVNRYSAPSDLKITDMRYCVTSVMGRTAIIRIDTNQGIYGLGEVRDAADERYALFLKSRILGENPCNVELIFKKIGSLADKLARPVESAPLKWHFGIYVARPIMYLPGNYWVGVIVIKSGSMRILLKHPHLKNKKSSFKKG